MKKGVAKNNSKAVQQREKVWERGVGGFFLKQSGLMDHWVCDKIQEYSDVPLKNALSVMACDGMFHILRKRSCEHPQQSDWALQSPTTILLNH